MVTLHLVRIWMSTMRTCDLFFFVLEKLNNSYRVRMMNLCHVHSVRITPGGTHPRLIFTGHHSTSVEGGTDSDDPWSGDMVHAQIS